MQKLWDAVDRYNKGDGLKEPWLDDDIELLAELLIQIIHRIGASAERRVERELLGTMKRVTGKNTLLCRLAEIALANPDGIIREVLFPVIDEQTLADLVKELKSTGPAYRQHVTPCYVFEANGICSPCRPPNICSKKESDTRFRTSGFASLESTRSAEVSVCFRCSL